jgi:folate-binding protein YgfZ
MTGYQALRQRAAWIDLSDRGKIRVTGEDRARLLHALSTNDIQNLAPGQTVYAFFLNEKGRIIADAYISNLGDALWLDTEPELKDALTGHLDRYIIADDVTLEDQSDSFACIGIEGPQAPELAPKAGLQTNASATGQPALRAFLPAAEKAGYLARLAERDIPPATIDEARIVRLENGFPRYGDDISDKHLVQETQIRHAVHPNKGCYLGQEIVERIRSRATVHRTLRQFELHGELPQSGAALHAEGDDKPIGEITSASHYALPGFTRTLALGFVRIEVLERKASITYAGGTATPLEAPLALP